MLCRQGGTFTLELEHAEHGPYRGLSLIQWHEIQALVPTHVQVGQVGCQPDAYWKAPCSSTGHSTGTWLKQYPTLMLHFSAGRQIFYGGGWIFYGYSTGTKARGTAADLIDSDEKLHSFTRPWSICDIKISVVSQCRILVAVQFMNTQLFAFFFDWQLAPSGLLSDSVTVDEDWRRLTC